MLGDGPVYPTWAKKSLSLLKWFKEIRAQLSFFLLFKFKKSLHFSLYLYLSLSLPLERNPIERPVWRGEAIEAQLQARIFSGIRGYMSGN